MTAEQQRTDEEWWRRTTVYQVYPRSFYDSNGDGVGDLPGVIAKLDYLHALGVETIWLSPFFDSPQKDFGYDIRDHHAIAEEYGSLDDVRRLIRELHARGMKVVFDLVLNHTSDQHPWFLESKSSRHADRRDFYLWRDGRKPHGRAPPNNWRSMLGGSGWHWDGESGQFYWASFLPFQPDLNYRNPAVKAAMLAVVRRWLDEGVDGFRLDIFNALFKDESFDDNPRSWRPLPSEDDPHGFFQRHVHTIDHPDTLAFARELRRVVDEYGEPRRFLVGEVFGSPQSIRRYCGHAADGLHLVFAFKSMRMRFRAGDWRDLMAELDAEFPHPLSPTWVFGNHDRPRSMHRVGNDPKKAGLLAALQLTARGVPFVYYGEEIGMRQHHIPLENGLDPIAAHYGFIPQWIANKLRNVGISLNRDECRVPMQWDGAPHAGFAPHHATPWLPMHPESGENNVAAQAGDPTSLLSTYRRMLWLRRGVPALHAGSFEIVDDRRLPRALLAFRRTTVGDAPRQVAEVRMNFSSERVVVHAPAGPPGSAFSSQRGPLAWTDEQIASPCEAIVFVSA